jgi:eukaryotic-like serine/threonine-protein kinase
MGSPAYMAPEQMESTKDVDPRADIWSLGVILYQLVTGRTPFHADTLPALCLRVINDPPPPLDSLRADLPDGFSEAVMRCLEKNREGRYTDVAELAEALAPYGGDESSLAVTRIEGVLHPGPPARLSYINTDVDPTLTASSEGLPPARPSDLPTQPPPRSHGTFTIGAGESMHHVGSRLLSAGWLGALIAAAGLAVLVLVIVLKSGNGNSAADPQVEPAAGSASAPQVTVTPLDPPPAKWTDIANDAGAGSGSAAQTPPVQDVPPPDPPVAHDDEDKKPPKKVVVRTPKDTSRSAKDKQKDQDKQKDHPKDTTNTSKGSGDDDAVWEHMTHDNAPAKPPEKPPETTP